MPESSAQPNGLELTLPPFFFALAQISESPILLRGICSGRRFGSGTASEVVRFPTSYHGSPYPRFLVPLLSVPEIPRFGLGHEWGFARRRRSRMPRESQIRSVQWFAALFSSLWRRSPNLLYS